MLPRIYADFQNLDDENRIRLTTNGTQRDLQRLAIEPTEGRALTFYMDDANDDGQPDNIMVDGVLRYSEVEKIWVAVVDWAAVYYASEIGGGGGSQEVVIPTRGDAAALDTCLRMIRHFWPEAVFENATTGGGVSCYESFSLGSSKEVFVYRDTNIASEWEEKGADPTLGNTMIHVLLSTDAVTLVVDDPNDPAIAEIVRAVESSLQMDILNLRAERKAGSIR